MEGVADSRMVTYSKAREAVAITQKSVKNSRW